MPNPPLIIGLGEILWDMLPAGRQLGGAPANFAYHAGALGARAAVVSRVGNDPLGQEILQKLDNLRLDRTHVSIDDHPTGVPGCHARRGGSAAIRDSAQTSPGTFSRTARPSWNWPPRPMPFALARSANVLRLVHIDPGAFLAATRRQCLRVFDINLRQRYSFRAN